MLVSITLTRTVASRVSTTVSNRITSLQSHAPFTNTEAGQITSILYCFLDTLALSNAPWIAATTHPTGRKKSRRSVTTRHSKMIHFLVLVKDTGTVINMNVHEWSQLSMVNVHEWSWSISKSLRKRVRASLTPWLSCGHHAVIGPTGVSEKLGCRNGWVRLYPHYTSCCCRMNCYNPGVR